MADALAGYPYEAISVKKYKSPHKNDLSFAKGERLRVTGQAPKADDDDEDDDDDDDIWLIGETLDGSKQGSFPAGHVERAPPLTDEQDLKEQKETEPPEPIDSSADATNADSRSAALPSTEVAGTIEEMSAPSADVDDQSLAVGASAVDTPSVDPVSISSPAAVESKPPSKPSSPPLAPKPSGLAARIAAFNKPQEQPPPLPRGKPGGWKPPPPAPGAPKPVLPGMSAAQLNRSAASKPAAASDSTIASTADTNAAEPPSSASISESQQGKVNAGFSAADAQSSIKMSLKERMAALQAGGAAGRGDADSARPPPPKPAAKPGKIDEGRRAAALAHLGPTQSVEDLNQTEPLLSKGDSAEVERETNEVDNAVSVEANDAHGTQDAEPPTVQAAAEEAQEEQSEEQSESERRAAIAARMARLGGRRMGTGPGPSLFGAPAPAPGVSRQNTVDEVASQDATKSPSDQGIAEGAAEVYHPPVLDDDKAPAAADTLAVPRRTAPPRRKKASSASSSQAPVVEAVINDGAEDGPLPATTSDEKERRVPDTAEPSVPTTVYTGDDNALTAEPEEKLQRDSGAEEAHDEEKVPSELGDDEAYEMIDVPPISASRQTTDVSAISRDSLSAALTASSANEADTFEPGTPVSHTELEEHARLLEAFVRTPDEAGLQEQPDNRVAASDDGLSGNVEEEAAVREVPLSAPTGAPPPRPPSARPPVPKTPTPAATVDAEDHAQGEIRRLTSPPPSRAPPVPITSSALVQADNEGDKEEEKEDDYDESRAEQPSTQTVLAAPQPRLAIPAEDGEDEADELDEAEDSTLQHVNESASAPAVEPDEMEDERQRRRRLAERMARMGAQPIMGAPMPMRNKVIPAREEEKDEQSVGAMEQDMDAASDAQDNSNEPEANETPEAPRLERLEQVEAPVPISSPPPIPTKSPPPPIRSPDAARRGSQILMAADLSRSASTISRPPVPSVSHSRQGTLDEREDAGSEQQAPTRTISPPALPSSPPPRMPMRAPPIRQASTASSDESSGARRQSSISQVYTDIADQPNVTQQATRLSGLQSSGPSPRDLDVMPSSHWWRHGRPVRLPPSLMRPDAVLSVTTDDDGTHHLVRVDLIFEDYSSTNISVLYRDDDASEEHTQIAQKHNFAPSKPSAQELIAWSQQYGARIAKTAVNALGGAGSKSSAGVAALGDGTSKGFIDSLIKSSTNGECLTSVGNAFGALLLAQAANTVLDQGADEPRAGDVVALHGADFKGKRGISSYHSTYGTANDPAFACVIEVSSDAKKRKLRCILTPSANAQSTGRSTRGPGGPEEVSLRLDDVKGGLMRIYRVAPKIGWLSK